MTFAEAAKTTNQCWAKDPTGKWIVFTGLDTVAMESFVRDRLNWPAIPIYHPGEQNMTSNLPKANAEMIAAITRALKWMRNYEEVSGTFGDDVVGKAEKALHEIASHLTLNSTVSRTLAADTSDGFWAENSTAVRLSGQQEMTPQVDTASLTPSTSLDPIGTVRTSTVYGIAMPTVKVADDLWIIANAAKTMRQNNSAVSLRDDHIFITEIS